MTDFNLVGQAPRALITASVAYVCYLVIYRLFFHPLRKIPGPKFAAATYWYEFYQDVILQGHYVKEYPRLHEQYGPIVRVSPDRVHVNDPSYYHEVYRLGTKFLKDPDFYSAGGGVADSIIMLINPERHRRRRDVVKTMFSLKTCEQQLAPEIQRIVARAIKKMTEAHESKKPLDMTQIFRMMSADTIMKILFDMDMNLIESDEIEPPYIATMKMFAGNFLFMKQFPFLAAIAINMPHAIAHKLVPGYTRFREQCEGWIDTIAKRQEKGDHFGDDKYTTYFDLLLGSQKSEKAERFTKEVLVDEAVAMCFAGTDTSSYALHFGTYYLLSNPAALTTLLEELKDVPTNDDGIIEYRDVANLPYFSAVIKEILRMACPVPGILPRKVPAAGSEACGYYLAPGTTVSQSIRMIHYNPEIFAEPNTFMPERWLGPDASELNKWFLAFSKGPRACIGPNIANIEMHIVFANIFKRFNMSVYGDAANVTNYRDSAAARIWQNLEVTVDSVK